MMAKLLPLILCIVLQACTSAPININYYLLHTAEGQNVAQKSPQATKIVLGKIILADYLRQNSLVIQLNKNQLYYSPLDIWAESLDVGINKALLADLNQQTGDYQYTRFAAPQSTSATYELVIEIEHFLASNDSTVIASGNYWLIDKSTGKVTFSDNFYLQKDLSTDGYSHAVAQLRVLLNSLSQNINLKITTMLMQD